MTTPAPSAPDYTDTDAFPAYETKQAILEAIGDLKNSGDMLYVIARINNTDTTGLSDGASTLDLYDSGLDLGELR